MKQLKLIGLALSAVLAAAAVLMSPQPAGATALCKHQPKEEGICGSAYEKFKFTSTTSPTVGFVTASNSFGCLTGSLNGEMTELATGKGEALKGLITQQVFTFCSHKCGATAVNLPYLAVFEWTSGSEASLKFEDSGAGPPGVHLGCSSGLDCTYLFESPLTVNEESFIGAAEASLGGASGFSCPGSGEPASWWPSYRATKPEPMYFADYVAPIKLCKKNETPCPALETYAASSSLAAVLEASTKAKFRLNITEEGKATEYTVPCESSAFEGTTSAVIGWSLPGTISTLKFEECGGTCSVTALGLSYSAEFEATGGGSGTLQISDVAGFPRLQVRCIGAYKCTYETNSISTSLTGGSPAKLSVNTSLTKLVPGESEEKCGASLKWEAAYRFVQPEAGGEAKMWLVREGV